MRNASRQRPISLYGSSRISAPRCGFNRHVLSALFQCSTIVTVYTRYTPPTSTSFVCEKGTGKTTRFGSLLPGQSVKIKLIAFINPSTWLKGNLFRKVKNTPQRDLLLAFQVLLPRNAYKTPLLPARSHARKRLPFDWPEKKAFFFSPLSR